MAALSNELRAARDRADFLGVYGGNRSAVDLLATLSREIPQDLDVRFDEITIDRRTIKVKVILGRVRNSWTVIQVAANAV